MARSAIKDFVDNVGGSTDLLDPVVKKQKQNASIVQPTMSGAPATPPIRDPSLAYQVGQGARKYIGNAADAASAIPKATYSAVGDLASGAINQARNLREGFLGITQPTGTAAARAAPVDPRTTTLPTMTVTPPTAANDLPSSPQEAFLANRGVPMSQQTDTAIGGDGTGDNAAQLRRSAIKAGAAPGQNVRLGYDKTSQIYGRSSTPGGRLDTFTGAGVPDLKNPTLQIDGAGAVAQQRVGLGLTPEQSAAAAAAQAARAAPGPTQPGTDTGNGWNDPVYAAHRAAASDTAAILNKDPRSVAGSAAWNANVDTGGIRNPRGRGGGGQTPYESAINALLANAQVPVADAQQSSLARTAQAGETQRANISADTQRYDAKLRQPLGEKIQNEDMTTSLIGADGIARPVLDTKGQAVKEAQKKQPVDEAGYAKAFADTKNQLLGVDPITGMVPDPANPGKQRPPTAEELQAAISKAHDLTQQMFGIAPHQVPGTNGIPPQAAAYLKANPKSRDQFEKTFGKGSAASILGANA